MWPVYNIISVFCRFRPAGRPIRSHRRTLMENGRTTIRLVYPQWQGGIVSHWMPELAPHDASRGYWLGAQLLNMLAPAGSAKTVQVPVSLDISERKIENGIMDYAIIVAQTKAALATLEVENPDAVVTLGGSVPSVFPRSRIWRRNIRTMWRSSGWTPIRTSVCRMTNTRGITRWRSRP